MNSQHSKRYACSPLVAVLLFAGAIGAVRGASYRLVGAQHALSAHAITATDLRDKVRSYRTTHDRQIIADFARLLSIPNLASDAPNILKNAQAIMEMMKARQIQTRLLELDGAPPAIFGELNTPGATSTITFYAHYEPMAL